MPSTIPPAYFTRVLEMSRQRFLHGLDRVPDDRLTWSPGESSHTPLQLAGRLASFLDHRTRMLTSAPGAPVARSTPAVPSSREEARSRVGEAFSGLTSAVEALSEGDLDRPVTAPWGAEVSAGVMLLTVLNVVGYFQGQLNYCQLAYGDTDPNIPPAWRSGSAGQ
jgi:hypothetical protein